ncbi:MAG: hypothetical protein G3M78_00080 [Candidatus Nitrohelix vancouverensis]|uniref:Uncharacterized protein n=1 Tax=Candidatus Nitrohelix vancouverensis TaxID=2705534 RepID=A0A7T0G1W3_9BACT|nr:MAG: hypothetical protein G3M78_00080 [Candidatus Nitrohelix vancouverensis]
MTSFKTLDIRGLSFFNGFERTSKEFTKIKKNGVLELILDQRKNFTDAFKTWAKSKGHKISDMDVDHQMVRLFIKKK